MMCGRCEEHLLVIYLSAPVEEVYTRTLEALCQARCTARIILNVSLPLRRPLAHYLSLR